MLLKEEYTKLQRSYTELERKYSKVATGDAADFSSFLSRLSITVTSLYGRALYSDIEVRMGSKTVPAHKLVFHARSEVYISRNVINYGKLTIKKP